MSEQELWERLQRTLHQRVTVSAWRHLKWIGLVRMFNGGSLGHDEADNWREFAEFARDNLGWLREVKVDDAREQAGELPLEVEIRERASEPTDVTPIPTPPLSERTAARARALSALDEYVLGPRTWGRVMREITSKGRPQGGFDETLPQ